jgi:hypothetical protein
MSQLSSSDDGIGGCDIPLKMRCYKLIFHCCLDLLGREPALCQADHDNKVCMMSYHRGSGGTPSLFRPI